MSIPEFLFVDDLALRLFVVNGLQKGNGQVVKCGGEETE
jgi:hypothetical protein